ncbi:Olfactory receptor 4A5 [Sciurus carolinensis]|uniref:Olfactory receptor 4A5 n=1 Tax=Sciurus carolinensis TaxID=30640 RepID=A0AA41NCF0_SCICA|nr:Olfactory receptor 4A5 [Sciurus carolinensis]
MGVENPVKGYDLESVQTQSKKFCLCTAHPESSENNVLAADTVGGDGNTERTISPKLIIDFLYDKKTISFPACMGQLFIEHLFGGAEVFLLVVMACDRYVAICKPLQYLNIMNQQVCILVLVVAWTGGFAHSVVQLAFVYNLPFCGPNVIDHFICDMYPLLELACTDTYFIGLTVVANNGAICMVIFILLLISY